MITQFLEDLENRIDVDVEEDLLCQWNNFLDGKQKTGFFSPNRKKQDPSSLEWPKISINDALEDFDLMALSQLAGCSDALAGGSGAIMNVRANYGTGILSSVFGAEIFVMDARLKSLPATRPLRGGVDTIKKIMDSGVPDLNTGYGERCFAMGKHYCDLFADYPKVSKYVRVYHPDLQGAIDICELLWGSELFVQFVDAPDLVHSFLKLIVETYIQFMHMWDGIIPSRGGHATHWGMMHKGHIMLRQDSAMNLSPAMFDEFIKPYDQQLLSEFGGGAIHFCGKGDHFIENLSQMQGVYAVNMSQPECNGMEHIFRHTVDKGIMLTGLRRDTAEEAINRGRDLRGRVHCW